MTVDMGNPADQTDGFETHRPHLFGLAYRMLGSVADAEDVMQDAWLRWWGVDRTAIANPRAFLSTVVTRLSLDRLKAARRHRETYVGPWLPEPLLTDPVLTVQPVEETAHDVSVALLLALERLSALERAAFILHDLFEMAFTDVAATLGRSEAACRQLARRARTSLREARPRFTLDADEGAAIARAFFAAAHSGDTATLRELLAEGASLRTDGGGRRIAALNVITGAARICRFYAGLARKRDARDPDRGLACRINGLPGWIGVGTDGMLQTTALEIGDGRVRAVYVVRNPDKLRHLQALLPDDLFTGIDPPGGTV